MSLSSCVEVLRLTIVLQLMCIRVKTFPRMDTAFFLSLLKPGDLVEFQRDGYQHWAVFIGKLIIMMIVQFCTNKEWFVY